MPSVIIPGRAAKGTRPSGPSRRNAASPQARGLLLRFPLNGTVVSDDGKYTPSTVTGREWSGTPQGGLTRHQPNFGDGLTCSSAIAPFGLSHSEGSFCCWLRNTSTTGTRSVFGFRFDGNNEIEFHDNGAEFKVRYRGNGTLDEVTRSPLASYTLAHVIFTWSKSADRIQFFFDGVSVGTASTLGTLTNAPTSLILGSTVGGESWIGMMQDVLWYDRALNATEAWSLYDPATRWDLYWQPGRRVFFDVGAAAATAARARFYPLLGAA